MITFKLDEKSAEAMISVLNAVHPNATFVQDITAQYMKSTAVVVEEVPAELVKVIEEPVASKKTKAAATVESV
jgi:chemotaxis regulatin CheY-phosphate phosphatase CheZ